VRDEADRESERLLDLRRVLVRADAVGRDVLEHRACVRRLLQRASRSRDSRLRVDDHGRPVDQVRDRREREQRRRRVAARVRDEPRRGWRELGHRVAPVRERTGKRVLEAVPLAVERCVLQPVCAREVDDDGVLGRGERGGFLVPEAGEDHVRAGRERLLVRAGRPAGAR
jgi:hypothetical protein